MLADPKTELTALLRVRNAVLWVVSREEARVEAAVIEAAGAARFETVIWDCVDGLRTAAGATIDAGMKNPAAMIQRVIADKSRRVYVLRDLHRWLDSVVLRSLRSAARAISTSPIPQARAIVVLTPSAEVPLELQGCATVIDWPIPTRVEMGAFLDAAVAALPEDLQQAALTNGAREAAIDAAVGLTADEASSCYAKSLVVNRAIVPSMVAAEKKRVIARERVLTWIDPEPRGLDAVGGLELLKAWLMQRKAALSKAAREFGLPSPKGVLAVGVPGCGKSLMARAVATAWGVPLLRLDLGALRSKWVGESESNIRKALSVAETVAPCVLWCDELEKALGGAVGSGGGAADGGVSTDALGALLTWLQERTASVFVVATANQAEILPAELTRKGRFDDVFFVDLPTMVERMAVLAASLRPHAERTEFVKLDTVAAATSGFSGAEIAALVPDALFAAFADGARNVSTGDLLVAARAVVPMSVSAGERISQLRAWAKGRARPASVAEVDDVGGSRAVDL